MAQFAVDAAWLPHVRFEEYPKESFSITGGVHPCFSESCPAKHKCLGTSFRHKVDACVSTKGLEQKRRPDKHIYVSTMKQQPAPYLKSNDNPADSPGVEEYTQSDDSKNSSGSPVVQRRNTKKRPSAKKVSVRHSTGSQAEVSQHGRSKGTAKLTHCNASQQHYTNPKKQVAKKTRVSLNHHFPDTVRSVHDTDSASSQEPLPKFYNIGVNTTRESQNRRGLRNVHKTSKRSYEDDSRSATTASDSSCIQSLRKPNRAPRLSKSDYTSTHNVCNSSDYPSQEEIINGLKKREGPLRGAGVRPQTSGRSGNAEWNASYQSSKSNPIVKGLSRMSDSFITPNICRRTYSERDPVEGTDTPKRNITDDIRQLGGMDETPRTTTMSPSTDQCDVLEAELSQLSHQVDMQWTLLEQSRYIENKFSSFGTLLEKNLRARAWNNNQTETSVLVS
eukprot:Filipodium_phascolosomae@DN2539_c0_g1_i3.p1